MMTTATTQTQTPGKTPQSLKRSVLAVCLTVVAIINFICAAFGVLLAFSSVTSAGERLGWILLFSGLSGGLVTLALAKIIRRLEGNARRLENIQKLLERRDI